MPLGELKEKWRDLYAGLMGGKREANGGPKPDINAPHIRLLPQDSMTHQRRAGIT